MKRLLTLLVGLWMSPAFGQFAGNSVLSSNPTGIINQAPVSLGTVIVANGSSSSSCLQTTFNSRIDFGAQLSQAGTIKIHRYLDKVCAVEIAGSPMQAALAAGVGGSVATSDGVPFQSFMVELDNTTGSVSNVSNVVALITQSSAITGSANYRDLFGSQMQPMVPMCNGAPCGQLNPAYTTFAAGEFHVGEFGNNQTIISLPMTTTATTYVNNRSIGGVQTLANAVRVSAAVGNPGTGGNILSTVLTFLDGIGTVPIDVYYYNASVGCADNANFAILNVDRDKLMGIAHVTDFTQLTSSVGQAIGPPIPYALNNATSLFACVVTRGSVTLSGTGNATLRVNILRQ